MKRLDDLEIAELERYAGDLKQISTRMGGAAVVNLAIADQITRAIAELRAIRRAGVLVILPDEAKPMLPDPVDH